MWAGVMGISLAWNISNEHNQSYELALQAARANFNKDQAFRLWGTKHGGVYVPPTNETPPNPYLSHISNRDIKTSDGNELTLMNPAYMVRQMMDDYSDLYGITGRIVGLVALNPNNIADEWEAKAIKAFAAGETDEVIEQSYLNGVPHLRLIRPMIMEEGCLKCHAHLGFKVGDVRGGVGVSLPMTPYIELGEKGVQTMLISHLIIFLLGLTGIAAIAWKARQYLLERQQASQQLHLLNEQLQSNVDELKRLEKLKDEFLANTSHELRTPLNGIIGIAESILAGSTGQINQSQQTNLNMLVGCGKRLFNLVNDLLDFSKLQHHDIKLKNNIVDMKAIVEVVIQLSRPLVGEKDLELKTRMPDQVPVIEGDEDRIQQILFNLVGNAIKFTASGYVEIAIEIPNENESEFLKIIVADTGIGIDDDKMDRIFESFEQADGAIAREYGGTGLGLSISKKLAVLQGGSLEAESIKGEGTQFILTFPINTELQGVESINKNDFISQVVDDDTHPAQLSEPMDSSSVLLAEDAVATILAVDDEPVNLQVISNQLKLYDYRVLKALSGKEALDILEQEQPDLILLDLMMPLMSGFEVCTEIRKKYNLDALPIVLLTAKNQVSDLVQGFESGANDFLTKPFSQNELLCRIKTHLQLKKETDLKLEREATIRKMNANLEHLIDERTVELKQTLDNLKNAQKQIIESEKMASLGSLVAGVAHEINTPLGVSVSAASFLHDSSNEISTSLEANEMTRSALEDYLDKSMQLSSTILKNLDRAAKQVQSFKQVAVDKSSHKYREIVIKEYLSEVILSLRPEYKKVLENISLECPETTKITTNPGSLAQIVTNLVVNSLVHGFYKDEFKENAEISIKVIVPESVDHVLIEYHDNGQGIQENVIDKIFEPFYTTRRGDGGTGLGLSIIYNLVTQQLGGEISCRSDYGKGVVFSFTLENMEEES